MKLGMEVGLGPGQIVLDGDPSPPKGGTASPLFNPHFSAYSCSGQMAGWIKMLLGTEVGLGPSDNVLDGDPSPPKKGASNSLLFGPCIVAKWLDASRCHFVWS